MKIFLDTAEIEMIRKFSFLVDGVTTNPSLIAKSKTGYSFEELIREISTLVNGPISAEVINLEADMMVEEARALAVISPNVVIKIPMTMEGLKATKRLEQIGIKTNVTLVFSANQALLAANCGATYVSIFVGRLDDIGHNGMEVVRDSVEIMNRHNYPTQIITASIRHPMHVLSAAKAGSHIATIPPSVLEMMSRHNLTDKGLEQFLRDWEKCKA
ncbi:fructose-6-phosphate aldolase [Methanoregula sp. UBA64]|uniref:fructose-6-phosphate aldolase n=1 Tax=Methanoregula sp. UBA64 TaxID=1915554 RepID=UPI0025FEA295|nr:fructose-6-phosphate aldolase [Methanoregula sp. UBA64]